MRDQRADLQRARRRKRSLGTVRSKDLPFAQKRFCGAEGIENVMTASAFRDSFGEDYDITIADGPMAGLLGRAVVVIGADGKVAYSNWCPRSPPSRTTTRRCSGELVAAPLTQLLAQTVRPLPPPSADIGRSRRRRPSRRRRCRWRYLRNR